MEQSKTEYAAPPKTIDDYIREHAFSLVTTPPQHEYYREAFRNYALAVFGKVCGTIRATCDFDAEQVNQVFAQGIQEANGTNVDEYGDQRISREAWAEYIGNCLMHEVHPTDSGYLPETYLVLLQQIEIEASK